MTPWPSCRPAHCRRDLSLTRRSLLQGLSAAALLAIAGCEEEATQDAPSAVTQPFDREQMDRDHQQREAEARAAFPFEVVEAQLGGADDAAIAVWERLNARPGVAAAMIGPPEAISEIAIPFHPTYHDHGGGRPDLAAELAKADAMSHPADLRAQRLLEFDYQQKFLLEHENPQLKAYGAQNRALMAENEEAALLGAQEGVWPAAPPAPYTLSGHRNRRSGAPLETVAFVLVPTDDPTTLPIHLRYGDWNACPAAPFHTAALRSWRDRYGAELVSMGHSWLEMRVARRPASREDAMALAREQQLYCGDVATQMHHSLSDLAANLLVSDAWAFWWD